MDQTICRKHSMPEISGLNALLLLTYGTRETALPTGCVFGLSNYGKNVLSKLVHGELCICSGDLRHFGY